MLRDILSLRARSQDVPGSLTPLIDHVEELLDKHNIRILRIVPSWREASSWAARRDVEGPPIHAVEDYFSWLHEIGHVVLDHQIGSLIGPYEAVQDQEVQAWRWAFRAACVEPDTRVLAVTAACLESYSRNPFTGIPHRSHTLRYTRMVNELKRKLGVERLPHPWELEAAA